MIREALIIGHLSPLYRWPNDRFDFLLVDEKLAENAFGILRIDGEIDPDLIIFRNE